jgi:hypothetical protein
LWLAGGQAGQQRVEIGARERPSERARDGAVVLAEGQQPLAELGERAEVVGGQCLALDDREEQLDLIQPGGVDRQWIRRALGQALCLRWIEAWPACELPLSTIQKTRRADA